MFCIMEFQTLLQSLQIKSYYSIHHLKIYNLLFLPAINPLVPGGNKKVTHT